MLGLALWSVPGLGGCGDCWLAPVWRCLVSGVFSGFGGVGALVVWGFV